MKKNSTKVLAVLLAITLLALAVVVGTLAYLADTDNVVTNTFTVGANVNITLTETTGDTYKIVPGEKAAKDPTLAVMAGSDACWVYVEVVADAALSNYVTYAMADGWVEIETGDTRVIYGRATSAVAGSSFQVLAGEGDGDYAKGVVTYKNVSELPAESLELTFKGYAIQADGFADADDAWDALDAQMNP